MQAVPQNPSALNLVQRASRGMKSPAEVIGLGMSVVFILLLFAKLIWKKIRGTESTAVSEAQMTSDSETEVGCCPNDFVLTLNLYLMQWDINHPDINYRISGLHQYTYLHAYNFY